MELLSLIRSPALPSIKVDPLDPPSVRYPSPSPAWIYTNAATDSALSILLSRLRILNLECTKTRLDVFGAISVSHPRYHFSVDITSGPTNVISSMLDFFDSSGVSVLWLMVHHEMVDLLVPRILRDFGSMEVLTLFKCGNIDEALRLMGSYNVTSNTWCVPRLQRFTIVDCQYEPHQLLKFIRARYVHDSQSSTQPDPLLSLQVAQLQDSFSLFQIKPDIKEEVESILGRDNVGWPVADEAELSTDSDSESEEDSEIDSEDQGKSQPWRRARRVKPIERDCGTMDVPYYFRKGKRHH